MARPTSPGGSRPRLADRLAIARHQRFVGRAAELALFGSALADEEPPVARAGLDHRTGLKLARIYRNAGLPAPQTLQGARVESGPDSPVYAYVAQTTRTLLPSWSAPGWHPPPRSTPWRRGFGKSS